MGLLSTKNLINLPVSKENIFNRINSLQIYEFYLNKNIKLPTTLLSPFRTEERASLCLFGKTAESVYYEDKATGQKGGCIDFVMQLFNLSFYEALIKINIDFKLDLFYNKNDYIHNTTHNIIPQKRDIYTTRKVITIQTHTNNRNEPIFIKSGIAYWTRYSIGPSTLKKHNVLSANNVFIDGSHFMKYVDINPIFAYVYQYKNEFYYKIYRPLSVDKSQKFFNDFHRVSKYLLHGVHLLPEKGNNLIITKSAKDCMVLDTLGFNSISVQSEGISILPQHINYLKSKWNNIFILYDNDYDKEYNWGQNYAQTIINHYSFIKNLVIPNEYKSTDISDVIQKYGIKYTKQLTNNLLK